MDRQTDRQMTETDRQIDDITISQCAVQLAKNLTLNQAQLKLGLNISGRSHLCIEQLCVKEAKNLRICFCIDSNNILRTRRPENTETH